MARYSRLYSGTDDSALAVMIQACLWSIMTHFSCVNVKAELDQTTGICAVLKLL
jgi:hypothetical protein